MAKRQSTGNNPKVDRWSALDQAARHNVPAFMGKCNAVDEFISVRFYLKSDNTLLGVLKCFGPDGTPLVCFGSGYDITGCMVALDGAIKANAWKVDTPYRSNGR